MKQERTARIVATIVATAMLSTIGLTASQREKQESVAGHWMLTADGGPHPIAIRLALEQDASTVTGTLQNPHGGSDFQVKGTLVGRKLALMGSEGTDLELSGELKDDGTMAGMLSGGRGDLQWIAKRVGTK